MTALAAILLRRIREGGPISVAEYMAECLLHPEHGYYSTRDPFGAAGDFTTAPEISQMFGEVMGLALAQAWLDRGSPSPFTLAELGPGRGTLMADILRATRGVPGFHVAMQVVMVEASGVLRAVQEKALAGRTQRAVVWVETVDALPEQPLFLIANEFFDALPVRQFQCCADGWRERLVGVQEDRLVFGLSGPMQMAGAVFAGVDVGEMVEVCPLAPAIAAVLNDRIGQFGGVAYVIDYGGWRSKGDTLQALKAHAFDGPLAHPGQADLTAHVDFEVLAAGAGAYAYDTQGAVLERLGIAARAAVLARGLAGGLTGAGLDSHWSALRRLTHPEEMGSLFKVLALTGAGSPLPPGFET